MRKFNETKGDYIFRKTLNKLTNKRNYKKYVNKMMYNIDNPITQEQIEAIILKQENSFSVKRKKKIFELRKLFNDFVFTAKVWGYYLKNKKFFDSFTHHTVFGEKRKSIKFPLNAYDYHNTLSKAHTMYNITKSIKNFKQYIGDKGFTPQI